MSYYLTKTLDEMIKEFNRKHGEQYINISSLFKYEIIKKYGEVFYSEVAEIRKEDKRLYYETDMGKAALKRQRERYNQSHKKERKQYYLNRKGLNLKTILIPTGLENTEGTHKHHINRSFVILLPSFIHNSGDNFHSLLDYDSMLHINKIAITFLLGKW